MAVKITYFVHGTTYDNLENKSTGWLMGKPAELSEKGIEQGILLRSQININDFDIVFASDLSRSINSAKLTFEDKKEIKVDKRLRECNYGDLNGKDKSLVKYEEHIEIPFRNGESLKDVEKRVRDFCNYLLENYDNKHIAIVCHRAPQLAFEVICNNKTWQQAIDEDWRKTKAWQPGWIYIINNIKED